MPSEQALEYQQFFFGAMGSVTMPPDAKALREMFNGFGRQAAPLDRGTKVEPVDAGGVPAVWVTPAGAGDLVIVFLHGGGYVMGSAETHTPVAGHLAQRLKARALVVDYRLAPEHPHPAPVEDCLAAYQWLLGTGVDPKNVVFVGESAGGALVITTQLLAKERGVPLPAATASLSPWLDIDPGNDRSSPFAMLFLGPDDDAQHQLVNPLSADLSGFGPLFIQVGGGEADGGFVAMAEQLGKLAEQSGVTVEVVDVVPDMLHMFQLCAGKMPEADAALDRIAAFITKATKGA